MMKIAIVTILLFTSLSASAQVALSDSAEVSIITCGPYQEEVYSAFGHTAIRISDPLNGMDLAFNYGTFVFNSAFYLNFLKGDLLYKLGISPYAPFRDSYISEQRFVHEQVLNLDSNQKQEVYNYLYKNAQPENATYRYDYFYNNCSTKVRDLFIELFGQDLKFNNFQQQSGYTIRELTGMYLQQQPWGELGIEVCLGLPMDKKLSPFEYMFLPDYTESGFDHATLNGSLIVKRKNIVFEPDQKSSTASIFHPGIVFFLFLVGVIFISLNDWKKQKITKWLDVSIFLITGFVGLLLFTLWAFTAHEAAAKNFNLLWAVPFHVIAAPILIGRKYAYTLAGYFNVVWILSITTLLLWFFIPQKLNVCLIPLVIALGIRAFLISRLLVKNR